MQRIKLTLEYDGRPFVGWQRQADQPSVQETLEIAAAALDGAPVRVQGAGRTDAGVHATGQVAHLDLCRPRPIRKIADALNFHLRPQPVCVLKAEQVDDTFNARFSATGRSYRYLIINRRADLTVQKGLAWRVPMALDAELMHVAAQQLIGQHDFTTFRDTECQAESPVRTLESIQIHRAVDQIEVSVTAPSFLHRQVRSIVGSLVEVGRGARSQDWMGDILRACDRTQCGPVAPACGLYLERVLYG